MVSPAPVQIADETFVVHHRRAGGDGSVVPVASLVVLGRQPLLVGAGPLAAADLAAGGFGLVEPGAVRWIFLSHHQRDHAGNVLGALAACANATVVTSWLTARRMESAGMVVPPGRLHLVDDGDVLDTGDRALVVERPPLHVQPESLGLLDASTRVHWTAECFSALLRTPAVVLDGDVAEWDEAFVRYHHWCCPWVHAVDAAWWQRAVDHIAGHDPAALVPLHGPALRGAPVAHALAALRELPMLAPVRRDSRPVPLGGRPSV